MADVSAEVMNALVRLMNNEIALDQLDTDALLALGTAARGGRKLLQRVIVTLNEQKGMTFAEIGAHFGVVESTASRWAKPTKGDQAQDEVTGLDVDDEPE